MSKCYILVIGRGYYDDYSEKQILCFNDKSKALIIKDKLEKVNSYLKNRAKRLEQTRLNIYDKDEIYGKYLKAIKNKEYKFYVDLLNKVYYYDIPHVFKVIEVEKYE